MSVPLADLKSASKLPHQSKTDLPRRFVTTCYAVHAMATPGLLPRLVGVLAKRGLMPDRWFSVLVGPDQRELHIDIQVSGLSPQTAKVVAEEMRKIVMVSVVMMSDKITIAEQTTP